MFLDEALRGVRWDAKYATWDNFTGRPVDGYEANRIVGSYALAGALREARGLGPDGVVLVNLSGRGDKDVDIAARYFDLVDADGNAHIDEEVR